MTPQQIKAIRKEHKRRERERKYRTAKSMHECGMKFSEIGELFGVGPQRARDLVQRGERVEKRRQRERFEIAGMSRFEAMQACWELEDAD